MEFLFHLSAGGIRKKDPNQKAKNNRLYRVKKIHKTYCFNICFFYTRSSQNFHWEFQNWFFFLTSQEKKKTLRVIFDNFSSKFIANAKITNVFGLEICWCVCVCGRLHRKKKISHEHGSHLHKFRQALCWDHQHQAFGREWDFPSVWSCL